jgi:1,4-dihydroxy-2-naphthoate octaprenyltransferase
MAINKFNAWMAAVRPKTLAASVSPVEISHKVVRNRENQVPLCDFFKKENIEAIKKCSK